MPQEVEKLTERVRKGTHTKEDAVVVSEIVRHALKYMVNNDIPPIPENFRLWFFAMGKLLLEGKKDPSPEEIAEAYREVAESLRSEISPEMLKKIQERTREILADSHSAIKDSIGVIESHDRFLNGFSRKLEEKKKEGKDVSQLIEVLIDEIREVREENKRISSELKRSTEKLRSLQEQITSHIEHTTIDYLTQVLNRGAFDRILRMRLEQFHRYGHIFSLMIIDPDNFKEINDTHGHIVGDEVLKEVAYTLQRELRKQDVVARYGGDEFAVIVSLPLMDALKVAERLKNAVAGIEMNWKGENLKITVSIGVAQSREGDTPYSILQRADAALYLAKAQGKNRVRSEFDLPGRDNHCGSSS